MKHILFINDLSKLVIKKDSTLSFAISLKGLGHKVYLLFEEDFFLQTKGLQAWELYEFSGKKDELGAYITSFELGKSSFSPINEGDIVHMRIDPPFDARYLRYLWMLRSLQEKKVKVVNNPEGVLLFNEKLYALSKKESLASFVGSSVKGFKHFINGLDDYEDLILKPLDLYQGIGVEKLLRSNFKNWEERFLEKVEKYEGAVVAQPYCKSVEKGEVRSVWFGELELGSILKVPPAGSFLANIAQGATYKRHELSAVEKRACLNIMKELKKFGVPWVAFDLLDEKLSEVNITCPGLIVEVSKAMKKDLGKLIAEKF